MEDRQPSTLSDLADAPGLAGLYIAQGRLRQSFAPATADDGHAGPSASSMAAVQAYLKAQQESTAGASGQRRPKQRQQRSTEALEAGWQSSTPVGERGIPAFKSPFAASPAPLAGGSSINNGRHRSKRNGSSSGGGKGAFRPGSLGASLPPPGSGVASLLERAGLSASGPLPASSSAGPLAALRVSRTPPMSGSLGTNAWAGPPGAVTFGHASGTVAADVLGDRAPQEALPEEVAAALEVLRQAATEACEARELLLRRLPTYVRDRAIANRDAAARTNRSASTKTEAAAAAAADADARAHASMVRLLRAAALRCVETIGAWHQGVRRALVGVTPALPPATGSDGAVTAAGLGASGAAATTSTDAADLAGSGGDSADAAAAASGGGFGAALGPVPFEWRGTNYLLKLADDVGEGLRLAPPMLDYLPPQCSLHRNPFLLSHGLDDTAAMGVPPLLDAATTNAAQSPSLSSQEQQEQQRNGAGIQGGLVHGLELARLRRAARLLLAEEALRGGAEAANDHRQGGSDTAMTMEGVGNVSDAMNDHSRGNTASSSRSVSRDGTSSRGFGDNEEENADEVEDDEESGGWNDLSFSNEQGNPPGRPPHASVTRRPLPPGRPPLPNTRNSSSSSNGDIYSSQQNLMSSGGSNGGNGGSSGNASKKPNVSQAERMARLVSGLPTMHPAPPVLPMAELEALAKLRHPPVPVVVAFAAARVLLSQNIHVLPNFGSLKPSALRALLRRPKILVRQLASFDVGAPVRPLVVKVLRPIITNPNLSVMEIARESPAAAALFAWVKKVVLQYLQRAGEKLPEPSRAAVDALHHPIPMLRGATTSKTSSGGGQLGPPPLGAPSGSFRAYADAQNLSNGNGASGGNSASAAAFKQGSKGVRFFNDPAFGDAFADVEPEELAQDPFLKPPPPSMGGGSRSATRLGPAMPDGDGIFADGYGGGGGGGYGAGGVGGNGGGGGGGGVDYGGDGEDGDLPLNQMRAEEKARNQRARRLESSGSHSSGGNGGASNALALLPSSAGSSSGGNRGEASNMSPAALAAGVEALERLDGAAAQVLRLMQQQLVSMRNELCARGILEGDGGAALAAARAAGAASASTSSSSSSSVGPPLLPGVAWADTALGPDGRVLAGVSPHLPPASVLYRTRRTLLWSGQLDRPLGALKDPRLFAPAGRPTTLTFKQTDDLDDGTVGASLNGKVREQEAAAGPQPHLWADKLPKVKLDVKVYAMSQPGGLASMRIEASDANRKDRLAVAVLEVAPATVDRLCGLGADDLALLPAQDRLAQLSPLLAALAIDTPSALARRGRREPELFDPEDYASNPNRAPQYFDEAFLDLPAMPDDRKEREETAQAEKARVAEIAKQARKVARAKEQERMKAWMAQGGSPGDLPPLKPSSKSSGSEDSDAEANAAPKFGLLFMVDPLILRGNITIDNRAYEVRVVRRGGYASVGADGNAAGGRSNNSGVGKKGSSSSRASLDDGMEVTVWPSQGGRGAADRLSLSLADDELELLLLHAPALFHRMRHKWSAQVAVAEWVVRRLRLQRRNRNIGLETDKLWLLRNITLPMSLSKGWQLEGASDPILGQPFGPGPHGNMSANGAAGGTGAGAAGGGNRGFQPDGRPISSTSLPGTADYASAPVGEEVGTGNNGAVIPVGTDGRYQVQHPPQIGSRYAVLAKKPPAQLYEMRLRQKGLGLVLTAVAIPTAGTAEYVRFETTTAEDEETLETLAGAHVHRAPPNGQAAACRLNLSLDEVRAFVGAPGPHLGAGGGNSAVGSGFSATAGGATTNTGDVDNVDGGDGGGDFGDASGASTLSRLMARVSLVPSKHYMDLTPEGLLPMSPGIANPLHPTGDRYGNNHDDANSATSGWDNGSFDGGSPLPPSGGNSINNNNFGPGGVGQPQMSLLSTASSGGAATEASKLHAASVRVAIGLDRTLFFKTQSVSGVPVDLSAHAHGDQILFEAQALGAIAAPLGGTAQASPTNEGKKSDGSGSGGAAGNGDSSSAELPIPATQLVVPLRKLVSMDDAKRLLVERLRVALPHCDALLHPHHRTELARALASQLKIVVQPLTGNGAVEGAPPAPVVEPGAFPPPEPPLKGGENGPKGTSNASVGATSEFTGPDDDHTAARATGPQSAAQKKKAMRRAAKEKLAADILAAENAVQAQAKEENPSGVQNVNVAVLETTLHCALTTLTVCVDGEKAKHRIGSIEVDDQATLAAVRQQLVQELDGDDLPESFRFRFNDAPCGRAQEPKRLAASCAPLLYLYSRDPGRDARYMAKLQGGRKQGDPNELFYGAAFVDDVKAPPNTLALAARGSSSRSGKSRGGGDLGSSSSGDGSSSAADEPGDSRKKKKKKKSKKSKGNQDGDNGSVLELPDSEETPDSDSDFDPPPGEPPAPKKPRESGMERRQRLRIERRRQRQSKKARRLMRAPTVNGAEAAMRDHAETEPAKPEPVEFVAYPLAAVFDVVQGSPEVWAKCLENLNDTLTGDDILRIGEVDSADYPVKARPDDLVRQKKPIPPPWYARPDVLAKQEAEEQAAAEAAAELDPYGNANGRPLTKRQLARKEAEEAAAKAEADALLAAVVIPLPEAFDAATHAVENWVALSSGLGGIAASDNDSLDRNNDDEEEGGGGNPVAEALKDLAEWDAKIQVHEDLKPSLDVLQHSLSHLVKRRAIIAAGGDPDVVVVEDDGIQDDDAADDFLPGPKGLKKKKKKVSSGDGEDDNDDDDDDEDHDEEGGVDKSSVSIVAVSAAAAANTATSKKKKDKEKEPKEEMSPMKKLRRVKAAQARAARAAAAAEAKRREDEAISAYIGAQTEVDTWVVTGHNTSSNSSNGKSNAIAPFVDELGPQHDLFAFLTPAFGKRTSGSSWYPKKEALDEILDGCARACQGADSKGRGGSGVPRLAPKGRYGQLGMDIAPLVNHPHFMVHTTALEVLVELGRGLRGDFFELVGGNMVFRLLVLRYTQKPLRPRLDGVLDALFNVGALPLDHLIDTDLPNMLDPLYEENKPIMRQCIWEWLVRCLDRSEPSPDPQAALEGECPPRATGRYVATLPAAAGGAERLCGSPALKLRLLGLALKGIEQDGHHVDLCSQLANACVRAIARTSVRAAAVPPHVPNLPQDYYDPGFDPEQFRARGPNAKKSRRGGRQPRKGDERGGGGSRGHSRQNNSRRASSRGTSPGGRASGKEGGANRRNSHSAKKGQGRSGGGGGQMKGGDTSTEEETSDSDLDEAAIAAAAAQAEANWRLECEAMEKQAAQDAVGRAARLEVLACGKWLSRFVDGLAPDSRLRGVVDTLQQVLVDTCATTCGTAFVTNPWQDGQVRVPWWFPSSAALEAQRAALDAAQRAAEEAALVEPPLKVKERLSRKLTETKGELDVAMRARNFMQCMALQKTIDQIRFELKNIPGLSEEIMAIVKLQGYCRSLIARHQVKEKRFLRSLPPPPWQTHRDPHSGYTYYFNPYSDTSTWQLLDTGAELRRAMEKEEARRKRRALRAARAEDDDDDDNFTLDTIESNSLSSTGDQLGGLLLGGGANNEDGDNSTVASRFSDQQPSSPLTAAGGAGSPLTSPQKQGRGAELLSPELQGKPRDLSGLSESEHMAQQALVWPKKPNDLVAVQLAVPFDEHRKLNVARSLKAALEADIAERTRAAKAAAEALFNDNDEDEDDENNNNGEKDEEKGDGDGNGGGDGDNNENKSANPKTPLAIKASSRSVASARAASSLGGSLGGGGGSTTTFALSGGPPSPLAKALKAAGGAEAVLALVAEADAKDGLGSPDGGGSVNSTNRRKAAAAAEAARRRNMVRDGTLFKAQQVWRMIPKDQDARPAWRIPYDNGKIPFEFEYSNNYRKKVVNFGIPVLYRDLEALVVDDWRSLIVSGARHDQPPSTPAVMDATSLSPPQSPLPQTPHAVSASNSRANSRPSSKQSNSRTGGSGGVGGDGLGGHESFTETAASGAPMAAMTGATMATAAQSRPGTGGGAKRPTSSRHSSRPGTSSGPPLPVGTAPLHEQRIDYFTEVSPKEVLKYAYDMVGHTWFPHGEGITESKWAKFVKEMGIFPDLHKPKRSAQVGLAFSRKIKDQNESMTEKQTKKYLESGRSLKNLNEEYFLKAIEECCLLRWPNQEDSQQALKFVLMETVMMMPEVNGKVWNEAKRLAMVVEGRKQSAATRVQAIMRKLYVLEWYRRVLRCVVVCQATMRQARCSIRYRSRRQYLFNDSLYRTRWLRAITIQMAFRRYVAIRNYRAHVSAKHAIFLARCAGRRVKQNLKRLAREAKAMMKQVRMVNGTLTCQEMFRASAGTVGDNDFSILLTVYVPFTQRTFKFNIPDKQFREYLYQATGKMYFGANEIMERKNLLLITDRLMCRKMNGIPVIYMSRKAISERGVQVARNGILVPGGGRMVVTVFWSNDEVVFQTYDPRNSQPMRTSVTMVFLKVWLTDEQVWQRKREKRLVNKDRGEARKILKREALGLAQPPMALEWAKDFLAKTGGDRESGIDAWMPDSPEWEVAEQPIEDFMAEAATTAKETALKRRLEAEAEMLGWTEEAANALAIANGDQPLSAKKGSGAKDGKNNNDDNDYDKEGGQWVKEYREKFPGYPVPPDKHVEDELLEMGEDPPLLKPNRKGDLIKWLLTKLHVHLFKQGEKRGTSHLVLEYQLDEDAQAEAASRVQGLQRMYAARVRLRQITMRSYEKRFDRDAQRYFYVFAPTERARHSAESPWQWRKPKCFEYKRLSLDCPMPVDEWRDMYTHATEDELRRLSSDRPALRNTVVTLDTTGTSQEDGPPVTSKYYFNCATGQYSKLTVDEAAARLQGMVRDFQLRDIGKITMRQMIKAVKLQNDSEEKYEAFPHRLSSLVNWAMVLHTMHHDVDGAKRLYKEATEISEENPVLLRAYALLILLTCEPPRNISWQRAMGMLRAAEIRDPDREKFKVSEDALFHWAVICNPKNGRCLLNYALLLQCVIKDYDLAEKFYRRAVAADPDDKFVVRNYNDFEAQRLPGGMYEGGGPALAVLKTSALQEERFEWAEWAFLRNDRAHDERFKLFWAAESLGKTSWEEPKWHEVWAIVLKRSSLTKDLGKWREYYDPKLKRAFFTNRHMYDAEHVDSPEIKYQKLSPYNTGDMKMAQGE